MRSSPSSGTAPRPCAPPASSLRGGLIRGVEEANLGDVRTVGALVVAAHAMVTTAVVMVMTEVATTTTAGACSTATTPHATAGVPAATVMLVEMLLV